MSVSRKVREVISAQLDVDLNRVRDDVRFIEDLGGDSLAVVETVLALEELFYIEISDKDLAEWRTVGDAVRFIEARVEESEDLETRLKCVCGAYRDEHVDPRGTSYCPPKTT